MRPGIIIQHARELIRDAAVVRGDIVGFIGVIGPDQRPEGFTRGGFLEISITRPSELLAHALSDALDGVTLKAVHQFFQNGGTACRVFGLCVDASSDLIANEAPLSVYESLIDRLRGEEDIGLLAMPALAYLPVFEDASNPVPVTATIVMLMQHCREMNNRFLIIDSPRYLHDDALIQWTEDLRTRAEEASSYGALYYPWMMNGDDEFPPSGCIAGVYARVEAEHAPFGIRWPPANQALVGVTHPAVEVRWSESDELVNAHINPLLTQPARGVIIWGARTLSREPQWVHINARRIVSLVSEQLRRDSEWVVFENQRPELWEIVARSVRSRLDQIWSAGLLTGDQAGLDYDVQCDAETNPLKVRDAGEIHVRVMLRPISTAEFIIVELQLGR